MKLSRAGLVVGLFSAVAFGCDSCCTDPLAPIPQAPVCNIDTTCDANEAFRFGACVFGGCGEDPNNPDKECCPGTRCRVDVNTCVPKLLDNEYECEQNSDCPDPAQRCISTTIGPRDPIPTCVYELCAGDSDCGFGRACYAGRCITTAPCGGGCPDGQACDVITSTCSPFPSGSVGCDAACAPGQIKLFTDPAIMSGESCCPLECECRGLPPIVPTRFGRYSRVAVVSDEVLVSAYDAQFGDLVVAHFKTDGTFARLESVDGLPPAGTPTAADPLGYRGGVVEPGPNVGTHTSIAVDPTTGLPRIAYRDEDQKALRVAIAQSGGGWTTHFVDGGADADASFGQFTDIAVGDDGTIFITYLAHNGQLPGLAGRSSGVKLARSRTAAPVSAADWDFVVVDARPAFDACNGQCGAGTACVLNSGAPQCLPVGNACSPSCDGLDTCVNTGAAEECAAPPTTPESPELPRGRGLHTSVALDGGTALVAYYDSLDGDVRVASVSGTTSTPVVLDGDGAGGRRTGDIGRFPTIAKIGQNVVVVYEDFGRHEVRAWQGAAAELGNAGTYTLVDRGQQAGQSGKLFVGAGARLALGASAPIAVYQDASNLNLKFASFDGTAWVPGALITDGAHGFYSDIAIGGGNAFIVSVEAKLDERGIEASRVGLTVQPLP